MTAPEPLKPTDQERNAISVLIDRCPGYGNAKEIALAFLDRVNRRAEAPALTESEREALEVALNWLPSPVEIDDNNDARAANSRINTIRALLARTDPNRGVPTGDMSPRSQGGQDHGAATADPQDAALRSAAAPRTDPIATFYGPEKEDDRKEGSDASGAGETPMDAVHRSVDSDGPERAGMVGDSGRLDPPAVVSKGGDSPARTHSVHTEYGLKETRGANTGPAVVSDKHGIPGMPRGEGYRGGSGPVVSDSFEKLEKDLRALVGNRWVTEEWANRLRALVEKERETGEKALYDQGCEYTTAFHSFTADLLELKAALAAKTEELERMNEARLHWSETEDRLRADNDRLRGVMVREADSIKNWFWAPETAREVAARLREEAGK